MVSFAAGQQPALPVLTTARLRLRPFRREDAAWVYYVSLDAELRRNLSLPDPYLRSHARYFVDHVALATAREGRGGDFVIEDPDTEIALGWIGLHRRDGDDVSCGFWLAYDARGQGVMTEALRAACCWAFASPPDGLGALQVTWQAHVGNHASRAVVERVGFTVEADTVLGRNGPKWSGHARPDDLILEHDQDRQNGIL